MTDQQTEMKKIGLILRYHSAAGEEGGFRTGRIVMKYFEVLVVVLVTPANKMRVAWCNMTMCIYLIV